MTSHVVAYIDSFLWEKTYRVLAHASGAYALICDQQHENTRVEVTFIVEAYASVVCEILVLSSDTRISVTAILQGEGATITVNGASLMNNENRVNIITTQHHVARNTKSDFLFKALVEDSAQISYGNRISIEHDAQESVSSVYNKNILVGSHARCFSVPSMEVLTDEVKAFHGSAISACDEQALFYGQARGMSPEVMKKLLIKAFFADMFVCDEIKKRVQERYE